MNNEIRDFVLPSAPAKTLWFEFLFIDGLLESHLDQENCDPSPIELIIQFVNNANSVLQQQSQSVPATNGASDNRRQEEKKAFLLKLMAVKTAAYFQWNLDVFEKRLPLPAQHFLISSLRHLCQENDADPGTKLFAEVTYYRWLIRSLTKAAYPVRAQKGLQVPIPQLQQIDPSFTPPEVTQNLIQDLVKDVPAVIMMLDQMLKQGSISRSIRMPTIASFNVKKPHFDWKMTTSLDSESIANSIRFEVGKYFMIRDPADYVKAYELFSHISQKDDQLFPHLSGYLTACRGMSDAGLDQDDGMDQEECQEVIVAKAFDAIFSFKTTDFSVLEKVSQPLLVKMLNKHQSDPSKSSIFRCLKSYLCLKVPGLRDALAGHKSVKRSSAVSDEPMDQDPSHEAEEPIEHQLLAAATPHEVLSEKFMNLRKSPSEINYRWRIPNIVLSVMSHLPENRRNVYLSRLAKANELRNCLRLDVAADPEYTIRGLYLSVMEETQTLVGNQIRDLLELEILKTDLEHYLSSKDVDEREMANRNVLNNCVKALSNLSILSDVSDDLIETICVVLLERCHPFLESFFTHPNPILRLTSIMYKCKQGPLDMDIGKFLWDVMSQLLLEGSHSTHKRVKFQANVPPPPVVAVSVRRFIQRLRSPEMQLVVAAALTKIFNQVREDTRNKLSIPAVVMNSHTMRLHWPQVTVNQVLPDMNTICQVLKSLQDKAVTCASTVDQYKTWIRSRAELALIEEEHADSMRSFLILLCTMTSYFTSFCGNKEEDHVIQRMITVSNRLNCHTQSAVLQQMLSEPNYALAFKSLSERNCFDSCDHLIECIWDMTLLEFLVNLNSKRGDMEKKNRSVQLIGQLELNTSNGKQILRDAANVRKRKFFRILTKKYM